MSHYLIEFRFFGKAKHEIRSVIYEVKRKFRLGFRKEVPHITLAGPFNTHDERRLIKDFYDLCSKSRIMKFKVKGFSTFEDNHVVYFNIEPSERLKEFRLNLSQRLQKYCSLRPFDYKKEFQFHTTVAMKLDHRRFSNIKNYVRNKPVPEFDHIMVRATLLRGARILVEYDFLLRKLLNRREALNRMTYLKTKNALNNFFGGEYDPDIHIRKEELIVPRKGIIQRIKDYFQPAKTFVIADLHLDHANIIRFCKRPFRNVHEMNEILVNNWNNTVRNKDTVYVVGDLVCRRGYVDDWIKKLNGEIILIKGNHDRIKHVTILDNAELKYKDKTFLLVHRPEDIPADWNGWSIVGHHHNNKPREFPFINSKTKQINVGVELIGYKPLDIEELFKMNFEGIQYKQTI